MQDKRFVNIVDKVGATSSFICAIHCALLPLLISVLPLVGLGFLMDETIERIILFVAIILAVVSSCWGFRVHKNCIVIITFSTAIIFLGIGSHLHDSGGHLLITIGGLVLVLSHMINHHLCKKCNRCKHNET